MSTAAPMPIPPAPPIPTAGAGAAAAPDATTLAGIAQSNSQGDPSVTKINSMADLKKKAPKVYRQMMEGIAMNICKDMQHHQERLKEMMDEANRNG